MADEICNDYGDEGVSDCLRDTDPAYRMDYTDIGQGYIHWCSNCGKLAHAMKDAIEEAFATRPGFAEELKAEIDNAEAQRDVR